jgi:hypothetical protein
MDDRLAILEQRVAELEKDVQELKADHAPPRNETPEQRGARLLRQAKHVWHSQPMPKEEFDQLLASLGLSDVPVLTPEQLQQEFLKAGIRPEDNAFSRGIIEMREE